MALSADALRCLYRLEPLWNNFKLGRYRIFFILNAGESQAFCRDASIASLDAVQHLLPCGQFQKRVAHPIQLGPDFWFKRIVAAFAAKSPSAIRLRVPFWEAADCFVGSGGERLPAALLENDSTRPVRWQEMAWAAFEGSKMRQVLKPVI